jgi:hypothetical protein
MLPVGHLSVWTTRPTHVMRPRSRGFAPPALRPAQVALAVSPHLSRPSIHLPRRLHRAAHPPGLVPWDGLHSPQPPRVPPTSPAQICLTGRDHLHRVAHPPVLVPQDRLQCAADSSGLVSSTVSTFIHLLRLPPPCPARLVLPTTGTSIRLPQLPPSC